MTGSESPATIDWGLTTAQKIGAVVGAGIGLGGFAQGLPTPVAVTFPVAYGVACAAIPRMRGIVRYERTSWFAAHELAMAAIAAGWAIDRQWGPAVFNASWMVSAGIWWASARRSSR